MKYNFDEVIERKGSGALKTDALEERYGKSELMAAWVADMDFATPDFIVDDLKKRLEHPILGYTIMPGEYYPAIIDWEKDLHEWDIKKEWISYIPGIVKGIGMVINVFTKPGDAVIIMPPVYHPFRITTEENGRKVVNIPLLFNNGNYFIDFEKLDKLDIKKGVLIFSNPHNPAGRVWSKEELKKLAEICDRKGIIVISDEIHADMTLWGNRHIPYMTVSPEAASHSITFCAPSKTFNIPGIVSSFSVISDAKIRNKFYSWLQANEFNDPPLFSPIATISAYRKGKEWRKEMLEYIEGNIETTINFFRENLSEIEALRPDASFLIWLDCRKLNLPQEDLVKLFVDEAGVALNDGAMFGEEGRGFMRLNIATPRSNLIKILKNIEKAVKKQDSGVKES